MSRGEVAVTWRARCADELGAVRRPSQGGVSGAMPRIVLSAHRAASGCPAADAAAERGGSEFTESAATAARRVAITALGRMVERDRPPTRVGQSIEEVLSDPSTLPGGLAAWVAGLDVAGRAVVGNDALAWALDLLGALRPGALRAGSPIAFGPAGASWRDPGSEVVVSGVPDVVSRRGPATVRLLVLRARPGPRDEAVARRIALVRALVSGEVTEEVVVVDRRSLGRRRVLVGPAGLGVAVEELVAQLEVVSGVAPAPERPGAHCRGCDVLARCPVGSDHLAERGRHWSAMVDAAVQPSQHLLPAPRHTRDPDLRAKPLTGARRS